MHANKEDSRHIQQEETTTKNHIISNNMQSGLSMPPGSKLGFVLDVSTIAVTRMRKRDRQDDFEFLSSAQCSAEKRKKETEEPNGFAHFPCVVEPDLLVDKVALYANLTPTLKKTQTKTNINQTPASTSSRNVGFTQPYKKSLEGFQKRQEKGAKIMTSLKYKVLQVSHSEHEFDSLHFPLLGTPVQVNSNMTIAQRFPREGCVKYALTNIIFGISLLHDIDSSSLAQVTQPEDLPCKHESLTEPTMHLPNYLLMPFLTE